MGLSNRQIEVIVQQGNGDEQRIKPIYKTARTLDGELIKVRTMLGLHQRMTSSVQRAMQAFTQAVSRLGVNGQMLQDWTSSKRGTKSSNCCALIMPEYRIAEQLPSDTKHLILSS